MPCISTQIFSGYSLWLHGYEELITCHIGETARLVVRRFRERNRGAQSGSHELQFYSDRSLKSGKPAVIAACKTFRFLICCESSSNRRCPRNISLSNRFRRWLSAGSRSRYSSLPLPSEIEARAKTSCTRLSRPECSASAAFRACPIDRNTGSTRE
jgi:hypothetical protein